MKKFITISLLGLMFYNIMGYYIVYLGMIEDVKEEMKSMINSLETADKIVLLKLPYSNGRVIDTSFNITSDNEFSYQGDMYDVVKNEIHDGYIFIYCINDTKEKYITTQLNNYIQDNITDEPFRQKKSEGIEKNLIKEFIAKDIFVLGFPPLSTNVIFIPQEILLSIKLDIDTPPPKA